MVQVIRLFDAWLAIIWIWCFVHRLLLQRMFSGLAVVQYERCCPREGPDICSCVLNHFQSVHHWFYVSWLPVASPMASGGQCNPCGTIQNKALIRATIGGSSSHEHSHETSRNVTAHRQCNHYLVTVSGLHLRHVCGHHTTCLQTWYVITRHRTTWKRFWIEQLQFFPWSHG